MYSLKLDCSHVSHRENFIECITQWLDIVLIDQSIEEYYINNLSRKKLEQIDVMIAEVFI